MRILHVAGGEVYGGIERMLATLAATSSSLLTQQFAVPATGRLWRDLQQVEAESIALPAARAARPLSVLRARRAFADALSRLGSDVAIFHGSWTHAMFAAVARERGLRIVFWQHAPIVDRHWPDRWAACTPPDILVANSRFTASAPAFSDVPCQVIHCPVPASEPMSLEERSAGRAALRTRDADVVVLMAARLEAWKGHRALIDAAGRLGRDAVKVWIAGGVQRPAERPYLEQLQSDIAAGGLNASVALLGQRSDIPALMRLADIYCQPNLAAEPFGIAIAEAMRARLPCVVSNAGGAAELVDPSCGILTAPGDAAGIAGAITQLAAHPARRDAMGRAGAARAARMTDPAGRLAELAAVLDTEPVHA